MSYYYFEFKIDLASLGSYFPLQSDALKLQSGLVTKTRGLTGF